MRDRYCGACRGERGCKDCVSAAKNAQYSGLAGFLGSNDVSAAVQEVREQELGPKEGKELLLVADLGTTTLAFVCTDENGTVLSSYGCANPQRKYAADVIGRVDYACRNDAETLNHEVKEALVQGFLFVHEKAKKQCKTGQNLRFGIAGNTVMLHLLLGESVKGFAKAPFKAERLDGIKMQFTELFGNCAGLEGDLVLLPCYSAFVGADLFAGAYFLDFYVRKDRTVLLADFGTNGELLLLHHGLLYATSSAMGTAFEGGRFSYAADLFRLIAEAKRAQILDPFGLLSEPYFSEGYQGLTEEDIREFQLAKGAVRAGIELLMQKAGILAEQMEEVFLAGGLGQFCNTEDLLETGLLPKAFSGKITLVGNSCIGGLVRFLKQKDSVLHCAAEVINLADCPEFSEMYYAYMNFEE